MLTGAGLSVNTDWSSEVQLRVVSVICFPKLGRDVTEELFAVAVSLKCISLLTMGGSSFSAVSTILGDDTS